MRSRILPLLQRAVAQLQIREIKSDVSNSEKESAGNEFDSMVVAIIRLKLHKEGARPISELNFIGSASPNGWSVESQFSCNLSSDIAALLNTDEPLRFTGTDEELGAFTRSQIEKFISTAFPS